MADLPIGFEPGITSIVYAQPILSAASRVWWIWFVRHGSSLSRFGIVSVFCVSGGRCRRVVQLIGFMPWRSWRHWTARSESSVGVHLALTDARRLG